MYAIEFHEKVDKDLKDLGANISQLVFKKLKKIQLNPTIGVDLGNKANMDLSGYKKVYVDNKRVRIVYKIIENKIQIFVIAIGKRDCMKVYQKALKRI